MAEKNNTSRFGGSILVPSVQELAKQPIIEVPSRYIRPDLHSFPIVSAASEIPVIDMSNFHSDASMHSELARLHSACKNWGFFQLVNHGVSDSLIEKMKAETQMFFNLPIEEKKKRLWQSEEDAEGFGQAFVVSEEQKLDWCDLFFIATAPPHLRKPRLFQNLPLAFRNTMEEYSAEVKNLAMAIFEQFEKALGIKEGELTEIFKDGSQSMRMNYYPPCPEPEKVIGLTPHSDAVGLTILLQINEMEGLKIKKDGNWVAVTPLPNAFIVNIGDIMEIITNGEYKSIEHCATVNAKRERLSIATFNNPRLEKEIKAIPSLITPHSPPLFTTLTYQQFVRLLFSRKLDGKSHLDTLRIHTPPT
ncbi:protein SRG1-like [Cucurbita moschata]|uniref:Protein SRG1-like n=1 Tax=Cucurbita moschata TaxID=3662 RepID=A0A6J1F704_CUCMO|nr:protein SRG1-like [Cucurbita moschata]